ncbi:MAG: AAA family ATPase, partial [Clostridiales Family XIII bacterium]|nr:AAA family ATPase [Clostridiales Family XIII bacterium]
MNYNNFSSIESRMPVLNLILKNLVEIEVDVTNLFEGSCLPSGTKVNGYNEHTVLSPKINDDYIFQDDSNDVILWFLDNVNKDPLYICGPVCCGKTSCVKQISARLNYPVFEITGHNRLKFPELAGYLSVNDNQMIYQYGPLALAMKYGGLFLLKDIDVLDQSTATGLNSILDGSPLCITENGGELIEPHRMFRFVGTAKTNGFFDETGLYPGTLRQNIAFMDRFTLCEYSYLYPENEIQLLRKKVPDLPMDFIQ